MNIMLKKLLLGISLIGAIATAQAQQSLGEMVEQAGYNWIAGVWVGDDGSGGQVKVTYKWAVNKNAVMVNVLSSAMTSVGLVTLSQKTGEIGYVAASDNGASVTGSWDLVEGNPALKVQYHTPDGETGKATYVHKKINGDTLEIAVYQGYSADYPTGSPDMSLRLKRQP